jgi:hypothetical protein
VALAQPSSSEGRSPTSRSASSTLSDAKLVEHLARDGLLPRRYLLIAARRADEYTVLGCFRDRILTGLQASFSEHRLVNLVDVDLHSRLGGHHHQATPRWPRNATAAR